MSKSKYKRGKIINSISEFDACPNLFYKWRDKTVHRSVLISLQYRTLLNAIISGTIWTAELISSPKGDKWEEQEWKK